MATTSEVSHGHRAQPDDTLMILPTYLPWLLTKTTNAVICNSVLANTYFRYLLAASSSRREAEGDLSPKILKMDLDDFARAPSMLLKLKRRLSKVLLKSVEGASSNLVSRTVESNDPKFNTLNFVRSLARAKTPLLEGPTQIFQTDL